jgi:hypothetical protein
MTTRATFGWNGAMRSSRTPPRLKSRMSTRRLRHAGQVDDDAAVVEHEMAQCHRSVDEDDDLGTIGDGRTLRPVTRGSAAWLASKSAMIGIIGYAPSR